MKPRLPLVVCGRKSGGQTLGLLPFVVYFFQFFVSCFVKKINVDTREENIVSGNSALPQHLVLDTVTWNQLTFSWKMLRVL